MVRDWGEEGAEEREQSYGRILAELQKGFPVSACYDVLLLVARNARGKLPAGRRV